ncbi:lipopolysaccharide export system permease protein [Terrimicrobium sacchariphilum]|uniref:Lipopolysaccharide export system permease protein n=1 Tax=Terrimicrobium sacchariphilum TaxID=690879 RepID=A0A146G6Q4_TERSA|nr:LptF/LptG family permease [Terrimicrobium sacchariphilum]GAT33191.1 lipopolysaccharide export system permease protein [Terrimicrobium sacchariphilum]
MKIIDRYVGMSVVATAFFGVVVLSLVLVLGNLFKELLDVIINNPDVPILTVVSFMALVLPFSMTFTIPWGFLTALLLVFGRISADNELIALRANGVSVPRLCIPVFLLAIVLTAICFWINVDVAPRAEQKMSKAIVEIATSNPAAVFRADEVVDQFPDRRIYVGGKNGDKLENLIVFEINDDGEPTKMVYASEGILTPDIPNKQLILKLFDARFEQRDEKAPRDISKIHQGIVVAEGDFPISLQQFYDEFLTGRRLSSYTLPELLNFMSQGADGKMLEASVELNKRFSASLACLAFALIAVPLGITTHRKETSVGFGLSLVVAFTYFFFIIMADTFRGNAGAHPALLIWIPNILFITLGAVLFYRLSKK